MTPSSTMTIASCSLNGRTTLLRALPFAIGHNQPLTSSPRGSVGHQFSNILHQIPTPTATDNNNLRTGIVTRRSPYQCSAATTRAQHPPHLILHNLTTFTEETSKPSSDDTPPDDNGEGGGIEETKK
eukprot:CAMPEP_0198266326 /NCGR_PEP_ID=MMETSP1447-20131203/27748_1 /TAXON_ID=420782 /ORGANISM="Chaetoceros dichaeta, Strain CCMP1751" /LENGTH=126 /DNA_ID=CAMNT_0043956331 /DNA_START=137 /DNA_END=518 /DNA_ORIENTATION=+